MNILVFIKRVPDTESRIRPDAGGRSVVEEGLNFVISPNDEYAVEEALRLREAKGGTVTVISAGPDEATTTLKKCLAMGADEAVLIKDPLKETYDGLRIARIIAKAVETRFPGFDLLLFGKASVGADNALVPSMAAEMLGLSRRPRSRPARAGSRPRSSFLVTRSSFLMQSKNHERTVRQGPLMPTGFARSL